jgi:heterotetrameric sarcosine oxidase gamma subunit
VIETRRFQAAPHEALLRLELWGDHKPVSRRFAKAFGAALPGPARAVTAGSLRLIWREPGAWMIRGPEAERDAIEERLITMAGEAGAVMDISGAAVRCALRGTDWRILLTYGGVFDAEAPAFGPGCVAGTVVEHIAVRYDVIAEDHVDVYVAPSYADDLFGYWASVARNLDVNRT